MRALSALLIVVAALGVALYAFYSCSGTPRPRSSTAIATADIPQADTTTAPIVIRSRRDRTEVLVVFGGSEERSSAAAVRIGRQGNGEGHRVSWPPDRAQYEILPEEVVNLGPVRSSFRGVVIPRPQLRLFGILGDRPASGFTSLPMHTGTERLLLGTRELLRCRLINALPLERSSRGVLKVFGDRGAGLMICLWTTAEGTTVWLYDINSQASQETK